MKIACTLLLLVLTFSCKEKAEIVEKSDDSIVGGDFSILKKLEDQGGEYKLNGVRYTEPLLLFKDCGFNWARFRLFHTPNMEGPVCNNLEYTMALMQRAKSEGLRILLDFHYSDTWADPGKQYKPKSWENTIMSALADSVYTYTFSVLEKLKLKKLVPDMVQIGNEISNGMLWPEGKIFKNNLANWENISQLINAGIRAVNTVDSSIKIMIHTDSGGDQVKTNTFFKNLTIRGIEFDYIGLSYYPWWHGTFNDLIDNINHLQQFDQKVVIVETAYYSNNYYPTEGDWIKDFQPYPPTEQGQYDFMKHLKEISDSLENVTGLFYWKPDGIKVENSKVPFLGRSLFDENGNANKGIRAWQKEI